MKVILGNYKVTFHRPEESRTDEQEIQNDIRLILTDLIKIARTRGRPNKEKMTEEYQNAA